MPFALHQCISLAQPSLTPRGPLGEPRAYVKVSLFPSNKRVVTGLTLHFLAAHRVKQWGTPAPQSSPSCPPRTFRGLAPCSPPICHHHIPCAPQKWPAMPHPCVHSAMPRAVAAPSAPQQHALQEEHGELPAYLSVHLSPLFHLLQEDPGSHNRSATRTGAPKARQL